MKHNKFVTIDIEGEDNIGVINLGDLSDIHKDDLNRVIREKTEQPLVEALKSHFDYPIKVRVSSDVKTLHPLTISYVVVVEDDDEDRQETVTLNETWIYSK